MAFFKMFSLKMQKQLFPRSMSQLGMSMIEIMIVISLIGVIMTLIVRKVMQSRENALRDQVKIKFGMLAQDLQKYRLDNNRYPTSDQGLNAMITNPGGDVKNWRGPYKEENKIIDEWGSAIKYESDGRTISMRSFGPDQVEGNEDDLTYPEPKSAATE